MTPVHSAWPGWVTQPMTFDLNRDPCPPHPVPRDKAGAYALQARGAVLAERVCGDVLNVVGFPLNRVCRELTRLLLGPGQEVTSAGMGNDVNTRSDITAGRGDVGDRT